MKEQTIAKFKYRKDTYKLLEITTIAGGYDEVARTCYDTYHYIIVKNRRRITKSKWKETAQKKFASLITKELLQTEITIDEYNTSKEELINENDIKVSKPKKDCKYCNIRKFQNSKNKYAMCKCPQICKGLTEVTIQYKTKPLEFIYSCKNCKYYEKVC